MASELNEDRLFVSNNNPDVRVRLFYAGFSTYGRHYHNYGILVDTEKERGELCFDDYGRMNDCKFWKKDKTAYCASITLQEFNEKFKKTVKELVPQKIFNKYLIAMDIGITSNKYLERSSFKEKINDLLLKKLKFGVKLSDN